jgi:WD40 repeat protein
MSAQIAVLVLLVLAGPGLAVAPPTTRRDRFGDPLPRGAVARLGSVRLRHLSVFGGVAVSSDGSRIVTLGQTARLWDRDSGRLLAELSRPGSVMNFTHDGKKLLSARFLLGSLNDEIWSHDLTTGKDEQLWVKSRYRGSPMELVLSKDGAHLAVYYAARQEGNDYDRLHLFDLKNRQEHLLLDAQSWVHGALAFSPDSKRLFLVRGFELQVWDVASRKKSSSIRLKVGARSLAVSPDGKTLAVHGDGAAVTIIRPDGKPRILTTAVKGEPTAGLGFSGDGKEVFFAPRSGPVVALDPITGKQTRVLVADDGHARSGNTFSGDGRWLVLRDSAVMEIIDTRTGKRLHSFDDHRSGGCPDAVASPDGDMVATWAGNDVRIWELRSGKMLRRIQGKGLLPDLRWTGDGKSVVIAGQEGKLVWYDSSTGRRTRTEALPAGKIARAALLSGGRKASCRVREKGGDTLCILDLARNGSRIFEKKGPHDYWSSPDGSHVLVVDWGEGRKEETAVRVLDTRSGKAIWEHVLPELHLEAIFSPRGDRVVVQAGKQTHIWDTSSGRKVATLAVGRAMHSGTMLGLSPDGRTLIVKGRLYQEQKGKGVAVRVGTAADRVQLIEVATGKVRHALPPLPRVGAIDFTRDGRHLITSHGDGTVLVWDVREVSERLSLRGVWDDLGSADAGKGFAAVCALAVAPVEALRILGEKLRPASIDGKKVRRWIIDLGADSFEARSQAEKQLKALGTDIESDLLKASEVAQDPEQRQRLLKLIAVGPASTRQTRALEALERIGTPEAVTLVKRLASGYPGSRLTREAKETLARLQRQ